MKRIVASIVGLPKSGKTMFLLSFPTPIVVLDYDMGIEPHTKKFPGLEFKWDGSGPLKPNEVRIFTVGYDDLEPDVNSARRSLNLVKTRFTEALNLLSQAGGGTLAFDTGTHLWQHTSYVKATEAAGGVVDKVAPKHYGEANKMFQSFVLLPKKHPNINLVLTHHMSDEWGMVPTDKGPRLQPTGELRVDQQKKVPALVDMVVRMDRREAVDRKTGETRVIHVGTIEECREDTGLIGTEMISGTALPPSYGTLVKLLGGE